MLGLNDGSAFAPLSVDLAEFTTDVIIDGTGPMVDFKTFYFGPELSNLIRVEIPTYGWSLDNLGLSVPEPTAASIGVVGSILWPAISRQEANPWKLSPWPFVCGPLERGRREDLECSKFLRRHIDQESVFLLPLMLLLPGSLLEKHRVY